MSQIVVALRRLAKVLAEIWYGLTGYEFAMVMRQERNYRERLFILILFGDLVGLPVLPPYYSLRLLPYVLPNLNRWQHIMLRERDVVDLVAGGGF